MCDMVLGPRQPNPGPSGGKRRGVRRTGQAEEAPANPLREHGKKESVLLSRRYRLPLFVCLVCFLFLAGPHAVRAASETIHAGYRSLVTWLPGAGIRLDVAVWYPTLRRPSTVKAGSWTFPAARNAPPLPGPWPLIVLSPASSGSRFAHHDLAATLARNGYIVAVPTHDGDSADDMRFLFTSLQLPTRAHQLSATLDLVLEHPELGPTVNTGGIGLVGFGSGGTAALLLAGATLTPEAWAGYCPPTPAADNALTDISPAGDDPYCTPYMRKKMEEITQEMREEAEARHKAAAMRIAAEESRAKVMQRAMDGVDKAYLRVQRSQRKPVTAFPKPPVFLPALPPLPRKLPLADPRFRAMALVSPGFSMLFDPHSLKGLKPSLLLIGAEGDDLNRPDKQALALRSLIAPPTPEYLFLPGADGPSFQALCPPDMAQELPDLCRSVTPDQREVIHQRMEDVLLEFFRRTLG